MHMDDFLGKSSKASRSHIAVFVNSILYQRDGSISICKVVLFIVCLFCAIAMISFYMQEYNKQSAEYKDYLAAIAECNRFAPKTSHNRNACRNAELYSSTYPCTVAIWKTGALLFTGGVEALKAIGRAWFISVILSFAGALIVFIYCVPKKQKKQLVFGGEEDNGAMWGFNYALELATLNDHCKQQQYYPFRGHPVDAKANSNRCDRTEKLE